MNHVKLVIIILPRELSEPILPSELRKLHGQNGKKIITKQCILKANKVPIMKRNYAGYLSLCLSKQICAILLTLFVTTAVGLGGSI